MQWNRRPLLLVVLTLASCRRCTVHQQRPSAPRVVLAPCDPSIAPASTEPPTAVRAPESVSEALQGESACQAQSPQTFLIDAHLSHQALQTAKAQSQWWVALQRSIRYRTEQYGYYPGFGLRSWNARPLVNQMRVTKFFGLSVVLHERVVPALQCVEQAIERDCRQVPYRPRSLAGTRQNNTYFGGDVSNHVYGIALDIDPNDNPCCNCVEPWRSNLRCRGKKSEYQRMAMPECWVSAFERYGFYWLGHDELEDTMHFEFLGDPRKVATAAR